MSLLKPCRVCESIDLSLIRDSSLDSTLKISNFSITDLNYGKTLSLYKCKNCNLIQSQVDDVTHFYEALEDLDYEKEREQRKLQAISIISLFSKEIKDSPSKLSLLDIGAGSGILVESALDAGFQAEGVEPSKWLTEVANQKNLKIFTGVLPHKNISKKYDVITIIDVIEHVVDPSSLLADAVKHLKPDGILVVVTPNVKSLAAKLLQYKWWHYRIAHITYFDKYNLNALLSKIGLRPVKYKYPGWYFSYAYLYERLLRYFPKFLLPQPTGILNKITIPINPYDSMMAICKHR